jgi:hypothetical protein
MKQGMVTASHLFLDCPTILEFFLYKSSSDDATVEHRQKRAKLELADDASKKHGRAVEDNIIHGAGSTDLPVVPSDRR